MIVLSDFSAFFRTLYNASRKSCYSLHVFFIRQLINMEVMRECSYPVAYEKWFARKFEFQDRGSVHEHAVKALTFLWIKTNQEGY